jgi:hypothetical protein
MLVQKTFPRNGYGDLVSKVTWTRKLVYAVYMYAVCAVYAVYAV